MTLLEIINVISQSKSLMDIDASKAETKIHMEKKKVHKLTKKPRK